MPRTVTLIRHAETQANAERRWQGASDAPLTDRGRDQVARLSRRFAGAPTRLVASDLGRTMTTAEAIGSPEADPAWREHHLGVWEGLTTEEVEQRYPGQVEQFFSNPDFALEGGESTAAFRARVGEAFDRIVDDLDDGEHATVVTHGGAIWAIANRALAAPGGPLPLVPSHNTALTRIRIEDDGSLQLFMFNDATHLDEVPTQFGPEGAVVTVFRHGETHGNVAGRWQGRSDSDLTDRGTRQVTEAAKHAPAMDALFTSPLGRAAVTAGIIGRSAGLDPIHDSDLTEMAFGTWENKTLHEAAAEDPDLFDAIYRRNEDLPRGSDGESFGDAGQRFRGALDSIVARNGARSLGVVSHGAVIRAFAVGLAGLPFADRNRLPVPRNSSMTRVVYAEWGVALAAYNVAPHLDEG